LLKAPERRQEGSVGADQTIEKLIATATEEFSRYSYNGTDVSRIARRTGMAPTTFYRCFKDKLDIFLAVHQRWVAREKQLMRVLMTLHATDAELVETCVGHHRDHLQFRRSLRQLSYDEPRVRQARARSRLEAIAEIRAWRGEPLASDARLALNLIELERLADALAEGELTDMGISESEARAELAAVLGRFRPPQTQTAEPATPAPRLQASTA
jgi:AcrR family transcriptional regulator